MPPLNNRAVHLAAFLLASVKIRKPRWYIDHRWCKMLPDLGRKTRETPLNDRQLQVGFSSQPSNPPRNYPRENTPGLYRQHCAG